MPLIRKDVPTPSSASASAGLSSPSADERWTAARGMNRPEDTEALTQALTAEEDARVREAILTSLARIGTPESAAAVLPLVRSDDAALRTGALDALRAMPQAAASHLPALLVDPDVDVRLLATELARGLESEKAIALLCDLLDREEKPNVCAAAIEVLTEVGDSSAAPALRRCAERNADDSFIGFAIKVALQQLQPPPLGER